MIIYLYIFHENSLLTMEIICLISTLYIIIYLTSLHCFYYVVFNVGYRQYQSHAIINYLYCLSVKSTFFTSDNQFGFKAGDSTEFCIYSLLEFIDFYKKKKHYSFCNFFRC